MSLLALDFQALCIIMDSLYLCVIIGSNLNGRVTFCYLLFEVGIRHQNAGLMQIFTVYTVTVSSEQGVGV